MNIKDKWGNLYHGFMLISDAEINLTKERADAAMKHVTTRYHDNYYQLQIDLTLFRIDLRKEDVAMKSTPHVVKSVRRSTRPTMSVGGKLQSIWQGYL